MSPASPITIERQAGRVATHHNRQRRLNAVLGGLLVAVVAIAPIPLGSNRPFFWAAWAALIGALGVCYLLLLALRGESLRFGLDRLWLLALPFAALLGVLAVQILPMEGVAFVTGAGETILSKTLSLAPGTTWLMLLQLATYGVFFFLMLQAAVNRRRARLMGQAILLIIAAHALYSLVALTVLGDTLLVFEKWAYAGFATGTFVNRNSFATFLAFGLVLGTLCTLREFVDVAHRIKGQLQLGNAPLYLAATGLILAALIATGSRMGLVAGLAGAGAGGVMALLKRGGTAGRGWLWLGILPALGVVALLLLYGAGTFERLGSLEGDVNVRGELYYQVIGMIAHRPWLGFGGGTFELAYPLFHHLPVSVDLVWDKTHSTYLALWVELGLIAGSLPLLIVLCIGIDALRLVLQRRGDWTAPGAAVGVIVVAAIHSLVDFSLEMEANVFVFLALLAIGVARARPNSVSEDE